MLAGACVAFSTLWRIPYIYTLIGFSVWTLANELVLDEDELISGGIHPEEIAHLSFRTLGIKAFLLISLCYLALQFPGIRNIGAI
ncbi:MAG: hypothetical protein C4516_00675 [Oxalobacter sp.]|nr:MAG: hypothetical protein C4516_00675 [Oxalobacter sp.]